jgi:two-component system, NtrC family, nitrogen regulation response regulator GlnG
MAAVAVGSDEPGSPQVARVIAGAVPALVAELGVGRPGRLYVDALALIERPLLEYILRQTGGNQVRAARLLGINRNTLRSRLLALGLKTPRTRAPLPA